MEHLIRHSPRHVWETDGSELTQAPQFRTDSQYLHQLEIPHFLKLPSMGEAVVIIPSDLSIDPDQEIVNEYGSSFLITEIVERRPARGSWIGERPHYLKLRYL